MFISCSSPCTGFYVVANGQRNGDNTSLQSISFISSGYGVVFYYHARHTWHASYMTGRLSVFVTFISNGTQVSTVSHSSET